MQRELCELVHLATAVLLEFCCISLVTLALTLHMQSIVQLGTCSVPKKSHEEALKQIGRYLKATCNRGLIINPSSGVLKIDAYPDAEFAGMYGYERHGNPSCVKSCTGYVINVANCPVMRQSKLQKEMALLTMETEIVAISHCAHELIPIMQMVEFLGPTVGLPVDCTLMHA
jgi:hypothetical protein